MAIFFTILLVIIAFGIIKVEMGRRKPQPIPAITGVVRKRK